MAMETWNRELEQRVWRRVRGEAEPEPDLGEMIRLSRRQCSCLRGRSPELLRREQQDLALLTALQELYFGKREPLPHRQRGRITREDCLHLCERQLETYIAAEGSSGFGTLFTALARRKRAQHAILLQQRREIRN